MGKEIDREGRSVDKHRRLTLPATVETFGWEPGAELDVSVMDDHTVILKRMSGCIICGTSQAALIVLMNGLVCRDCIEKMVEEKILILNTNKSVRISPEPPG